MRRDDDDDTRPAGGASVGSVLRISRRARPPLRRWRSAWWSSSWARGGTRGCSKP